jgi:hypothetical protein
MLKRLFCFTLFFTSVTITWAQTSSGIQMGQMVRQTMKESWADVEPIGQDDQGVYYIMVPYSAVMSGAVLGNNNYFIALVNEQAELVKKTTVNFMVDGKESRYEFTKEINGKVLIFTSVEDKKAKSVSFHVFELDKKTLEIKNPRRVVQLSFAQLKKDYEGSSFKSELSRDKTKMLISYSLVDDENTILTFGYVVLDANLKEIFKWAGNLDMSDGVYLFDQFRVSNKGEVYLLTRYFKNSKALDKNTAMKKTNILSSTRSMEIEANYEQRIVKFESNGGTKIIPITSGDKFYVTLDIEITADGSPILIGFYSKPTETLPIGAVCLKLNSKTGVVSETGSKEFGNEYQMPSDISIKNSGLIAGDDQYLNYRFILSDIHFNKNGGYTLIGERTVMQTKRTGNTFYTVNHTDDLAVVDVTSAGIVQAVHKVNKSQQASDFEVFNASYFYTELNNIKYFAFANLGKGNLTESSLVKITPDGKQTKETLFSTKDAEATILPKDCQLYKGKKLIIYAQKNNRYVRWLSKQL